MPLPKGNRNLKVPAFHTFTIFELEQDRIVFQGIDGRNRYVDMDRIVFEKRDRNG